jgi:hypothetical protein
MMSRSLTPFIAAWVTHLARWLWPASGLVFMQARLAGCFRIQPTESLCKRSLLSTSP